MWLVDEEVMTVSRREVTVSEDRFNGEVSILSGLEGGEIIAGAGAAYLHEGMTVRAWESVE